MKIIVDEDLWDSADKKTSGAFQCHPLVNTSTLVISRDNLRRFLDITGHQVHILDVPSKD